MGAQAGGWPAELHLRFGKKGARTVLAERRHRGPLLVQKPFFPDANGGCHVYLLHPPGGLVGGDELCVELHLEERSNALVTTPAAGKIYRSDGRPVRQRYQMDIAREATLEWLPQETLLFNGAQAESVTRVNVAEGARFLGWDIFCLGRVAAGEQFSAGRYRVRFELWQDNKPLWLERGLFEGGSALLAARWGLAGHPVSGTLVCTSRDPELIAPVRAALSDIRDDEEAVVSQLDHVIVCRYRGTRTDRARALFGRAWEVMRPAVVGVEATPPRIWST